MTLYLVNTTNESYLKLKYRGGKNMGFGLREIAAGAQESRNLKPAIFTIPV